MSKTDFLDAIRKSGIREISSPGGTTMRNHNQLRAEGETMEQFKARRARGSATNIMGFMAECREAAGWAPAKTEMIQWFHQHRARLHERLLLAVRLP